MLLQPFVPPICHYNSADSHNASAKVQKVLEYGACFATFFQKKLKIRVVTPAKGCTKRSLLEHDDGSDATLKQTALRH